MSDALTIEDLALLDELAAETIEPIAPPASVKALVMDIVTSVARSRTIRSDEGRWVSRIPGVEVKPLSIDHERGIATILVRLAAGARLPPHEHHGNEECYIVSGSARIGPIELSAGDFHHADGGTHHHSVVSDHGATLLLVVSKEDYYAA